VLDYKIIYFYWYFSKYFEKKTPNITLH